MAVILNFTKNDFNLVEQNADKFRKLLEVWKESYSESNFKKLLSCIVLIDRHDIYDDIIEFLGIILVIKHVENTISKIFIQKMTPNTTLII